MSTGAKVILVIAVVGLVGLLVVGGLVVVGLLFFTVHSREVVRQEVVARQTVLTEKVQVEAARMTMETKPQAQDEIAQSLAKAEGVQAVAETLAKADARPVAERRKDAMARAVEYLLREQAPDGSWGKANVGITALCVDALVAGGKTLQDPPIRRAVDFLLKAQKPDGGIYDDVGLKTYCTSISLMVLVETDAKAHAAAIGKAKAWLIDNQWDEGESIDRTNPWYGGHGYGQHQRPDLSNTQYFVEAMHQANVPKDHPLWARVVVFVSRSQDLSETNDKAFAGTDSGGMVYAPVGGGESKAGTVDLPDGKKGLKAYGSMTYAGFKSFIYADLKRDDPRVKAALEWIRKHWTFEENPELGQQGLYYYYQTAAKALKAWGEDKVLDSRRRSHDWREELTEAILKRQRPDGSWTNEADRWFEGFGPVPTSYALGALAECQ